MTIHITIKNEDLRANAVVEVISTDEYPYPNKSVNKDGSFTNTSRFTESKAILHGGQSIQVYVTSTMKLEIIERQNDN